MTDGSFWKKKEPAQEAFKHRRRERTVKGRPPAGQRGVRTERRADQRSSPAALCTADDAATSAWRDSNKERERVEEDVTKRDEELISLQQSLITQEAETEGSRSSLDEWEDSRLESMEESRHREVNQLKGPIRAIAWTPWPC